MLVARVHLVYEHSADQFAATNQFLEVIDPRAERRSHNPVTSLPPVRVMREASDLGQEAPAVQALLQPLAEIRRSARRESTARTVAA